MADEKKAEHINLKVLGQDNNIIQFKIKKQTPLRKLMTAYCDRTSLAKESVRFRFDGAPVNELDTPETLEMEDGDTIEVYQPQTGGYQNCLRNSNLVSKKFQRSFKLFHSGTFS